MSRETLKPEYYIDSVQEDSFAHAVSKINKIKREANVQETKANEFERMLT